VDAFPLAVVGVVISGAPAVAVAVVVTSVALAAASTAERSADVAAVSALVAEASAAVAAASASAVAASADCRRRSTITVVAAVATSERIAAGLFDKR